MNRRQHLMKVAALGGLLQGGYLTQAVAQSPSQNYPSKPIRWIVPYAPGGETDFAARFLSTKMPEFLGEQTFVVENRPGGVTVIGTQQLASSPPDGYTIAICTDTLAANQYLLKSVPYNYEEFELVRVLFTTPLMFVVSPTAPVKSMKEAIQWMKKEKLTYGTWGAGSTAHLAAETLSSIVGARMIHVPYSGAAPSVQAMLAGQIDVLIVASNSAIPYMPSGKLKPLGVSTKQRMAAYPEVPTIAEAIGEEFDINVWVGVMAPKGTPKEIVNKLSEAISTALRKPDVIKTFADRGDIVMNTPPAGFKALLAADAKRIEGLVKSGKVSLE